MVAIWIEYKTEADRWASPLSHQKQAAIDAIQQFLIPDPAWLGTGAEARRLFEAARLRQRCHSRVCSGCADAMKCTGSSSLQNGLW